MDRNHEVSHADRPETQFYISAVPRDGSSPRPHRNILATEEEPLLFRTIEEARHKIDQLNALRLNLHPPVYFDFHTYEPDNPSNEYVSVEEITAQQTAPQFSAGEFDVQGQG